MDIVRAGSNPAECKEAFASFFSVCSVAGVMVSIVAFQAVDPGSIPGPRKYFFDSALGWTIRSSLLSLVVEHSLCKRKVGGSIPPVG